MAYCQDSIGEYRMNQKYYKVTGEQDFNDLVFKRLLPLVQDKKSLEWMLMSMFGTTEIKVECDEKKNYDIEIDGVKLKIYEKL